MTQTRNLDLTLLSDLVPPAAFTRIDRGLEARLQVMPETAERVEGCVYFCDCVGRQEQEDVADDCQDARRRQKFLRAALSDYVSMEDAAKIDFESGGRTTKAKALRIRDLTNPHLHVVWLLRHANVHLAASRLSRGSRRAVWRGPNGSQEFEHMYYVVANLRQTVGATREACRYTAADLDRMLEWLDHEQSEWGIENVVLRAAEMYGLELVNRW